VILHQSVVKFATRLDATVGISFVRIIKIKCISLGVYRQKDWPDTTFGLTLVTNPQTELLDFHWGIMFPIEFTDGVNGRANTVLAIASNLVLNAVENAKALFQIAWCGTDSPRLRRNGTKQK